MILALMRIWNLQIHLVQQNNSLHYKLKLVRAILKKKKTTVLFSEILMKDNIIIGQQILCLVLLFYIIMTQITKFAFGKS